MNQRVKRAIAAAMSLTMVATATPVSPLYNAIQNAVSSVMMQANASENKYIDNYADATFSIATLDDLNLFAEAVNSGKDFSGKTVELANNFDMGDAEFTTPIGTSSKNFKGTFDGNNKTIKLNINKPNDSNVGLFGFVLGATIRNITVEGSVAGKQNVGGICGKADSTNVYNCINNATVNGSSYYVGGICGSVVSNSNVYNCTNNATVTGNTIVGGICGNVLDSSNVYNCTNTNNTVTGTSYVGGIYGKKRTTTQ